MNKNRESYIVILESQNESLIEKLKVVEFSLHQIELDRNNLLEELEKRDKILETAKHWIYSANQQVDLRPATYTILEQWLSDFEEMRK